MNTKVYKTLEYEKILQKLSNNATSVAGKELCLSLSPMENRGEIIKKLKDLDDTLTIIRKHQSLNFCGVKALDNSFSKLEKGACLHCEEILAVSDILTIALRTKNFFRDGNITLLNEYWEKIEPLSQINKAIKSAIIAVDEYDDNASPELARIRRDRKKLEQSIRSTLNNLLNENRSILNEAVITIKEGRFTLPIKPEFKSKIKGTLISQSATGSTLFIEPQEIYAINNQLSLLDTQEKKEIERILDNFSNELRPHSEAIKNDIWLLAQLDFLFAKANLALDMDGSKPILSEVINLKDARHPLIDKNNVVPINISIGGDIKQIIITGPNTGGKTVTLKTVGLIELMGMSGLFIPCFQGSEIKIFHEVYADIGDEQSIEQSLSTFSAHMTNIVSILKNVSIKDLVLLDEIGAGTDPIEGAALATSILEHLLKNNIISLATTHYSELKIYALTTKQVLNASCEFDVKTLRPTYKLLMGIPGKSNAFEISKRLGLSNDLIASAKTHLETEDVKFEDIISSLEKTRQALTKEKEDVDRYKAEIADLKASLKRKNITIDNQTSQILDKAKEKAREIIADAKEVADSSIKEITKYQTDISLPLKEKTKLNQKLDEYSNVEVTKAKGPSKPISPKKMQVGDRVFVMSLNTEAIIQSLPDKYNNVFINIGPVRSKVNIKDLEKPEEEKTTSKKIKPQPQQAYTTTLKSAEISTEINLIGQTVDEALYNLDKYLDDALLCNLAKVRIVHGKGTGALRNAVRSHLKKMNFVAEYKDGEACEGGSGATVVTFK